MTRDLEHDFSHEDHQRTLTDEAIFVRINEDSCKLADSCAEPNAIAEKSLLE